MINEVVEIKFKKQNVKVEYHTFVKFSKKDIKFNSLEKNIDKYSQYLTYCKLQLLIHCYKKLLRKLPYYTFSVNFQNLDFKHNIRTYKEDCGVSFSVEVKMVRKDNGCKEEIFDEEIFDENYKVEVLNNENETNKEIEINLNTGEIIERKDIENERLRKHYFLGQQYEDLKSKKCIDSD